MFRVHTVIPPLLLYLPATTDSQPLLEHFEPSLSCLCYWSVYLRLTFSVPSSKSSSECHSSSVPRFFSFVVCVYLFHFIIILSLYRPRRELLPSCLRSFIFLYNHNLSVDIITCYFSIPLTRYQSPFPYDAVKRYPCDSDDSRLGVFDCCITIPVVPDDADT